MGGGVSKRAAAYEVLRTFPSFQDLDTDGDSLLSVAEICDALQKHSANNELEWSEQMIEDAVRMFDQDGDMMLDESE